MTSGVGLGLLPFLASHLAALAAMVVGSLGVLISSFRPYAEDRGRIADTRVGQISQQPPGRGPDGIP